MPPSGATLLPVMRQPPPGHAANGNNDPPDGGPLCGAQVAYFTRVQVTVLHSTAATHPDRSSSFLLLTVTVPA